jgi:uncharacterized protein (TIGR02598 family)
MDLPHSPRVTTAPAHQRAEDAFSLVEITLAIGIIAFAFVALFGLLPTGLTVYRSAVDSANETWIMQNLNSMVQVTDWPNVRKLGFDQSGEIYYFDEEGRQTDTELKQNPALQAQRIYAVKLIIDDLNRPNGDSATTAIPNTWRIVAVIAQYPRIQAGTGKTQFSAIKAPGDLTQLKKGSDIHSRAFVVARMDSEKSGS